MDRVGIDVSVVSLTCPNVFWGSSAVSLEAARVMNDEMARARKDWPERIQWLCSLPWQRADFSQRGRRVRRRSGRRRATYSRQTAEDSSYASAAARAALHPAE